MQKVKVRLLPIVTKLNMPTVLRTAILPGESIERLFIATQVGEIYHIGNGVIERFLDISSQIIELGVFGGRYDERGLLGLAFHPKFRYNGLFYLHYSVAGTQGPGALPNPPGPGENGLPRFFAPDPCDPTTLNLKWENRETKFDHIDTIEEWVVQPYGQPEKRRTLLNIRRPFFNHNGVNSLNFSPETEKLILTIGDGGSGYDPFNLSQNDMEIAGKIIEIDVDRNTTTNNLPVPEPVPVVTRFNELPLNIQEMLAVIAKGVRNMPGISFQRCNNHYIKYVGNIGQDLVESIYSFGQYNPIPVTQLTQASIKESEHDQRELINFGWRGWEGDFSTQVIQDCESNPDLNEKITAYYDDAIKTSVERIPPLTCYYHQDPRPDKFEGSALTAVQFYMGNEIPDLKGNIVFTDFALEQEDEAQSPARGTLAYTNPRTDCKLNDYSIIEIDYDFGPGSAFYASLGTNLDQTALFLGVYGSMNVTDLYQGTVFQIVP